MVKKEHFSFFFKISYKYECFEKKDPYFPEDI